MWERGVGEGDGGGVLGLSPVDWERFAESEGWPEAEVARLQLAAAELVSPLLFAPQFVGVKPPERVAFDLVVDQVAVTLHQASRDGLSELEAVEAGRERAEELAARVREAGLEGAPDVRRTASPPAHGVEDVSSSVGGVGQCEPVGNGSSERESGEGYPGESQPGSSTVQATANQGSAEGDVAASGQLDAGAGTAKRVQRSGVAKERLNEWVVRAQAEGGARTATAGLRWMRGQGLAVNTDAWLDAWRAATGKKKKAHQSGVDKARLYEWVVRAQEEGGARTAREGLKWVRGQGFGVDTGAWGEAWRGRGVLDHWSADLEDDEDPVSWEASDGVGERDVAGDLDLLRAEELAARVREAGLEGAPDVRRTASPPARGVEDVSSSVGGVGQREPVGNGSSERESGEGYPGESQPGPSTVQATANQGSAEGDVAASGQQDADAGKAKRVRRPGVAKERLNEWVVRAQEEGGARTAEAGLKWLHGQGLGVDSNVWRDVWRAATGKEKQVQRPGVDKERLKEWVVRAQEEGGAKTATAGMEWARGQGFGFDTSAWRDAWRAATGKEKRVWRSGVDKARLNEWVVRAQEEGGARTAEAGMEWVHGQGFGVDNRVWGDAWRAATGKEKRVRQPGVDKARLYEWVVRAQEEGGARTAMAGLRWVRGQGVGVVKKVWLEAWRGRGVLDHWSADFADEEDPFVWERGVAEGDVAGVLDVSPVDWERFAESEGWPEAEVARLQLAAAELVSPLLFAPQFVGVKPPERVAFDLVVDQVAVTLHQASRDGLSELEAVEAGRERAEELAARVREAGLEGAPDMRRTASPPVHGVEDVSQSVGGVEQREPVAVGDAASERGSAEAYPGESQPGPSTVQTTANQGLAEGDVAASGQQDADAGTAKRVKRSGVAKERLNEWVVRAQEEGGARTAAAGLRWMHGQGIGVHTKVWGDAWRAAAGKGKQVQRPGVAKDRLNEWVVRAQAEGRARTAAAGLKWARGQGLGVKRNVWWDAWRAEAGKEKQVQRPGVDKDRVYEWVLRAQQEGGAKTAEAGLEWVREQGFGVNRNVWLDAWRGRGVLDHWSADFEDDEDPFSWEGVDGVGERDVAGVLGLSPVDWERFAESEGWPEAEVARLQLAAAELVSPLLFAPQFVGVKPPERVAFDLVVDQIAVTLHRASRDGLPELDAAVAARTHAGELAARVREAGLEGAPDMRRTASPPVHRVEDVSSSVGGVGQREPVGYGASEWGAGEVYPGESQAGPSTVQATANQGSAAGGVADSGQQDADAGKAKWVRRPAIDKEAWLKEWVARAQNEGGAKTATAGLKWARGKGFGVHNGAWGEAWRVATGKGKRGQRPERLNEWVARAKEEGGARTAAAGREWARGQGLAIRKTVWWDAWRAEAGKEKRVRRPGVDKKRLNEWVVRAQQEGGAKTAEAGLEWVHEQGFGVTRILWSDAWHGRGVLDHWSADFEDDEDPFSWEGVDGVGERDVAGDLDLLPVDWERFAESEGSSEVEVARLQLAAAELVSPLLFAPQFVGEKPPERVAFDLVVDQVAVTLHRASRDGLPDLDAVAAGRTRAEELAARVREAGLEGAPDLQ
ncbi:hypothetical protein [Saccharopolyspora spinosa]|uniref:hypothetical protein n=1 Tax=Saccharopolyspora spinosa TaxID=60894 RepID=UPI003747C45B